MSDWCLIDPVSGQWHSGPFSEQPQVPAGLEARTVADGWPDTKVWSPAAKAFAPVVPPMSECDRLVALLVSLGTITQAQADEL